jgi:hypothetical protein
MFEELAGEVVAQIVHEISQPDMRATPTKRLGEAMAPEILSKLQRADVDKLVEAGVHASLARLVEQLPGLVAEKAALRAAELPTPVRPFPTVLGSKLADGWLVQP